MSFADFFLPAAARALCVRALCAAALFALATGSASAAAPFVGNGNGTVTDTSTGLMWDQSQALAQGQTEEAFDAQAELDGRVGEDVLAPALAAGGGVPLHVFVKPDGQRLSGFERGVVRGPVGGLVTLLCTLGFSHAPRLPVRVTGFAQQNHLAPFVSFLAIPQAVGEYKCIGWCIPHTTNNGQG